METSKSSKFGSLKFFSLLISLFLLVGLESKRSEVSAAGTNYDAPSAPAPADYSQETGDLKEDGSTTTGFPILQSIAQVAALPCPDGQVMDSSGQCQNLIMFQ
jgi:hypothetical protein